MLRSFSFGFLKPDALEDGLENEIFRRIQEAGLVVIATKFVVLTTSQVDLIYKQHKGDHYFPDLKEYLASSKVLIFVVGSENDGAITTLKEVKGHPNVPGTIRGDLKRSNIRYSAEEIELWKSHRHPRQDEVTATILRSRLHSAGDSTEAKTLIEEFFNEGELGGIVEEFPDLGDFMVK